MLQSVQHSWSHIFILLCISFKVEASSLPEVRVWRKNNAGYLMRWSVDAHARHLDSLV